MVIYTEKRLAFFVHKSAETEKCERFFMQNWFSKKANFQRKLTEITAAFISLYDSFRVPRSKLKIDLFL